MIGALRILIFFYAVTLILGHAKMCALNPSHFGRSDIIFWAHAFAYRKTARVMVCASLMGIFLVVT